MLVALRDDDVGVGEEIIGVSSLVGACGEGVR